MKKTQKPLSILLTLCILFSSIRINAFAKCTNLKEVQLPHNLARIGEYAFAECTSLVEIEIPKSLVDVYDEYDNISTPESPFYHCSNLKSVTFEEGCTVIADGLFSGCDGLEQITIPDTITAIYTGAFSNCANLSEITIPNTVDSMGTNIFSGCTGLKKTVLPNIIQNITEGTFQNCTSLTDITLPDSLTAIQKNAFNGCGALASITIPGNVTTIEEKAFYDCDALTTVVLSDSVTSIGKACFKNCERLSTVTLSALLTAIPSEAFMECPSLEKLIVPYYTTSIGADAFKDDTKLIHITIPKSVTSIDSTAFSPLNQLTISGTAGSYANTFATENGIAFNPIEVPTASSLALSETSRILYLNKTAYLYAIIKPLDYTGDIVWSSSDPEIVSVTENGQITAHKCGTAVITATTGEKMVSCEITVLVPVSNIVLDKTNLTILLDRPYQLNPVIKPENAFNKKLLYSSSDESVVTVDETGLITPHKIGTAEIRIQSEDGCCSKTCYITVKESLLGDVNRDGDITVNDALSILKYIAKIPQTAFDISLADCDKDNYVTINDALAILKYIAGLIQIL